MALAFSRSGMDCPNGQTQMRASECQFPGAGALKVRSHSIPHTDAVSLETSATKLHRLLKLHALLWLCKGEDLA